MTLNTYRPFTKKTRMKYDLNVKANVPVVVFQYLNYSIYVDMSK